MMDKLMTIETAPEQSGQPRLSGRSSRLLIGALVLGLLANWFFFEHEFAITVPLFVAAFYGVFFMSAPSIRPVAADFSWLLLIPIALLSLNYFLSANDVFYLLNLPAIPILIVLQTTLISGKAESPWTSVKIIYDLFYGFLYRPFAFLLLPFHLIIRGVNRGIHVRKNSVTVKVLLGLLAAFPLAIIVVSLLASADGVFGYFLGSIPRMFAFINLDAFVPRIVFAGIIALCAFSYIWSLISKNRPFAAFRLPADTVRPAEVNQAVDGVITLTVLSTMNAIYLFFTAIQFSYLFSGFSSVLPQAFTYAEYARRGFFELVFVTLINFVVIIGCLYWTNKTGRTLARALQVAESLLIGCTLVMLTSAFVRMYLYEQMYGFTRLRVLTHAFMILLFVLSAVTLCRIWNTRMQLFKYYLIVALTAFVVVNYARIDLWIARWNITRYEQTGKIDVGYLTVLSDDAVPQLVRLLHTSRDEKISGTLGNELLQRRKLLNERKDWQSMNLATEQAKRLLAREKLYYNKKYDQYAPTDF